MDLRTSHEDLEFIAYKIAACMRKAEDESRKFGNYDKWDPQNEVYWHTREKAFDFSGQLHIKWPKVLDAYKRLSNSSYSEFLDDTFWVDMAHPNILIKEVMNS